LRAPVGERSAYGKRGAEHNQRKGERNDKVDHDLTSPLRVALDATLWCVHDMFFVFHVCSIVKRAWPPAKDAVFTPIFHFDVKSHS
jgi:hypothetical protein